MTGLTSNPTIFDEAIGAGDAYDDGIREKVSAGRSGEALFVELALEDLRRAADMLRPIFDATDRIDGWVSMELPPLLAADTTGSIEAAARIYRQAGRPNLFIKIPGTAEGVPAIEESIFAGCADQRHSAVFARAVPCLCAGVSARHRAAHRRRP